MQQVQQEYQRVRGIPSSQLPWAKCLHGPRVCISLSSSLSNIVIKLRYLNYWGEMNCNVFTMSSICDVPVSVFIAFEIQCANEERGRAIKETEAVGCA